MEQSHVSEYNWEILLILVAPIILFAFATDLNYDPEMSREVVFSTLATVQSAVFAIVFSIIVLGVQLSSSQYAPRLATDFVQDRSYSKIVKIFGFSIGINIISLLFIDQYSQNILIYMLMLSVTTATIAFYSLFLFINETLSKTTPEGVLTNIRDNMTCQSMISNIKQADEDPTNPDPFIILISVISSFVGNKDRSSAILGLDILSERVSALLGDPVANQIEKESALDTSLNEICVTQLPNLVEESLNNGLIQICLKCIDTNYEIGEAAIENQNWVTLDHSITGLTSLIGDFEFDADEEKIRSESIRKLAQLLKEAGKQGLWENAASGTRKLGWIAAVSVMIRDQDDGVSIIYTNLLSRLFPDILQVATTSYATFRDHSIHDWLRIQRMDSHPVARLIISCHGSMAELTSALIRNELKINQNSTNWNQVSYGWAKCFELVDKLNIESLRVLWYGTILYLEYLSKISPKDIMSDFDPHMESDVSQETHEQTVEMIKQGNFDPGSPIELKPGGPVNRYEHPLTGWRDPIFIESDTTFEQWVSTKLFVSRVNGLSGRVNKDKKSSTDE